MSPFSFWTSGCLLIMNWATFLAPDWHVYHPCWTSQLVCNWAIQTVLSPFTSCFLTLISNRTASKANKFVLVAPTNNTSSSYCIKFVWFDVMKIFDGLLAEGTIKNGKNLLCDGNKFVLLVVTTAVLSGKLVWCFNAW